MSTFHNLMLGAALAATAFAGAAQAADGVSVARGRYIAKIAGCNDCHTAGYSISGGKVPEKNWLMGDAMGWHGEWGTTYAPNLRIYLQNMSETEWVKAAKNLKARPPMPWFALHDMSEADLRSFYRLVKSLGPVGSPVPAYLPPGEKPKGPFIQFPPAPK